MKLLKEFKEFAMRGNVIDLAVAVIIGAAFGKIVSSLVDDMVMPLLGLVLGGVNIAEKSVTIGSAIVKWGLFLQNIIDFIIIAFAIFLAIKVLNRLKKEKKAKPEETEVSLLKEIRDLLREK